MNYKKHLQWSTSCLELINQEVMKKIELDISKQVLIQADVEFMRGIKENMTKIKELNDLVLNGYNQDLVKQEINLINQMCFQVRKFNPEFNLLPYPAF